MKATFVCLVALVAAFNTSGQGLVTFWNYGFGGLVDAPVYLGYVGSPTRLSGTNPLWRAALLGGPTDGTPAAWDPAQGIAAPGDLALLASPGIGATWVTFYTGTGAGYVNVGGDRERAIYDVPWEASQALYQMVAWQGPFTTWADAYAAALRDPAVLVGVSNPVVASPDWRPDYVLVPLLGLQPFAITAIPEPAPSVLMVLGLSLGLVLCRSRGRLLSHG